MKIIIIGNGKVGYTLAEQLSIANHDLTIIDQHSTALQRADSSLDVMCISGNGASIRTLLEAGARQADLVIAVTNYDEVNIVCCLLAKKLGAKHTIARIRDPEYSADAPLLKEEIGLDLIINPELAAAREISRVFRYPSATGVDTFARGQVEMVGFTIEQDDEITGIPLGFSAHPASDTALGGDSLGYLVCRKKLLEEIASQPILFKASGLSALGRQPTLRDIFRAASIGDKLAQAVVRYAARWFAVSLRQLLFLADPDIIIIQGDYAGAGDYFLSTLKQYVQSYVAPAVDVIPDIRLSALGETASCLLGGAIIGAGALFSGDEMYE